MTDIQDKKQVKERRGRPRTRHGGYSLLTRGELPENRRYLRPYLSTVREGLIHDLAGKEEELTTAQRVLVDRVVTFLGVVRLMEEHAKEKGIFINSQGMLNPALSVHYLAFNRNIKEVLALLGIERRQVDSEPTLAEIIREHDEAEAKHAQAEAPVVEGGGPASSENSGGVVPGGEQAEGEENDQGKGIG